VTQSPFRNKILVRSGLYFCEPWVVWKSHISGVWRNICLLLSCKTTLYLPLESNNRILNCCVWTQFRHGTRLLCHPNVSIWDWDALNIEPSLPFLFLPIQFQQIHITDRLTFVWYLPAIQWRRWFRTFSALLSPFWLYDTQGSFLIENGWFLSGLVTMFPTPIIPSNSKTQCNTIPFKSTFLAFLLRFYFCGPSRNLWASKTQLLNQQTTDPEELPVSFISNLWQDGVREKKRNWVTKFGIWVVIFPIWSFLAESRRFDSSVGTFALKDAGILISLSTSHFWDAGGLLA